MLIDRHYQPIINNHSRLVEKVNRIVIDRSVTSLVLTLVGKNGALVVRDSSNKTIKYTTICKDDNVLAVRLSFNHMMKPLSVHSVADDVNNILRGSIMSKISVEYTLSRFGIKFEQIIFTNNSNVLRDYINKYLMLRTGINSLTNLTAIDVFTTDRDKHTVIKLEEFPPSLRTDDSKMFYSTRKVFIFSTLFQIIVKGLDPAGKEIRRLIIPGVSVNEGDFVERLKYEQSVKSKRFVKSPTKIISVQVGGSDKALEGERFELECNYKSVNESSDDPVQIYWTFGKHAKAVVGLRNGIKLRLENITKELAGNYSCHAYTRYESKVSPSHFVDVLYGPKIENFILNGKPLKYGLNILNIYEEDGDDGVALLACNVSGNPIPISMLTNGTQRSSIIEIFTNQKRDNITITCIVPSTLSDTHVEMSIQLNVWPRFTHTEWTPDTECNNCSFGSQIFTRYCLNYEGLRVERTDENERLYCQGNTTKCEETDKCKVIDGVWGNWTKESECTEKCHLPDKISEMKLKRVCDSPAPKNGGKICKGASLTTEICERPRCDWTNWSVNKECPVCRRSDNQQFKQTSIRQCLKESCNGTSIMVTECAQNSICLNQTVNMCPKGYSYNEITSTCDGNIFKSTTKLLFLIF